MAMGYFFGQGGIIFRKVMKIKDPNIAFAVWIQEMLGGFNVNVDLILGIDWAAGVFSYKTLLYIIIIFMFLCSIGLYLTVPKTVPKLKIISRLHRMKKLFIKEIMQLNIRTEFYYHNIKNNIRLIIIDASYESYAFFDTTLVLFHCIHNKFIIVFLLLFLIFQICKFELRAIIFNFSDVFHFENDANCLIQIGKLTFR